MLQNIIVAVILVAVAAYLIYAAIKFFSKKNNKKNPCENCSGCDLANQLRYNCSTKEKDKK